MRILLSTLALSLATPAWAKGPDVAAIVEGHVLPGYQTLSTAADALAETAATDCAPESDGLRTAYNDAFDAWISVSHLRFGPSEADDRAFALAFWPDPRGSTPKTLARLIRDADPVVETADAFATISVAARGFYAMEFLLYDAQFAGDESADYRCALIQAVATDIARNASAILADWENGYAALMSEPGNDIYRSSTEAAQQFFTALSTGLEFTSGTRIARPLGTFDRPRPARAEARRSGRSLRHVVLSLDATKELAEMIAMDDPSVTAAFDTAISRAAALEDPVFAGVAEPQSRLRVEALKQHIDNARELLALEVGPSLGIAAGFNSLDGD